MESRKEERKGSSLNVLSLTCSFLLSLSSGLVFSCVTVFVKHMKNIHTAQLLGYRYWALASLALPQLFLRRECIFGPPGDHLILFLRGLFEAIGIFLAFVAFRYLPLGEAAVLISCYPAFITVAAKIFLKESFGLIQVISVILTIIGMIAITGVYETINFASYTTENIYGLLAGLASSTTAAAQCLLLRRLKHVHYSSILFTGGIVSVSLSVIITLLAGGFNLHYKGQQQLFIILIGLLSYVSMMTLTVAIHNMEAGPVSTIRASSDIFSSLVFQVLIFGDIPNGSKIIGAILVCSSIVLIGFKKQLNQFLPDICINF